MFTRSRSVSRDSGLASSDSQSSSQSSQSSLGDSAPQEEYAPSRKKPRRRAPAKPTQWVCILPRGPWLQADSDAGNVRKETGMSFISLPDPRTGSLRRFLVNESTGQLCEVMKFSDEPRSWFIGNTVQEDGSLFICTPMDPLFLVLPFLMKAAKSGKYTTLDVILEDGEANVRLLEKYIDSEQWKHVCDLKVLQSGMKVFRYSQEKTLKWLEKKVKALAERLREEGVYVGAGSVSSLLTKQKRRKAVGTEEDYMRYSCGMVCDYLQGDLAAELTASLGLSSDTDTDVTAKERKLSLDEQNSCFGPPTKKPCLESNGGTSSGEPLEDYTKMNYLTQTSATLKEDPRKKAAAKGMKSLSSFFAPKPKKSRTA